jgi:hypothetical protein
LLEPKRLEYLYVFRPPRKQLLFKPHYDDWLRKSPT